MTALVYYLLYPFIYLVALLPFRALYGFSDVLYHVLRISGYRKKIILQNLSRSFPDKSLTEIDALCKAYYHYLCDLTLETLKTLRMDEAESRKHCTFHNTAWLDKMRNERKSFIIIMGHYGNWEWAGPGFTLATGYPLVVIYRPLSNPYFERMTTRMRTRFGTRITPVNLTLRDMVANRQHLTATAFVADQTAPKDKAYWMTFLNQNTAVFTGAERLAVKFNYPVVYMNVKRIKRGYYDVFPEMLFSNPQETAENEISHAFMKRLEQEIMLDPIPWLWSHRRWKHTQKID